MQNRLSRALALSLAALSLLLALQASAKPRYYDLEYHVELLPSRDAADVEIRINDAKRLRSIEFSINPKTHSRFKSNGKLIEDKDKVLWLPEGKQQYLRYRAKISRKKNKEAFDALLTKDWAIFRGDKLIPGASVRGRKNAHSRATLHFKLPKGWTNVDTGWPRHEDGYFIIDNPERRFDRPTGWIIAGKVGSRRDYLPGTEIAVAAPSAKPLRRMDILHVLNNVWPEVERSLHQLPPKILIVGSGNPMWRGALSSPNSFYMHADRPIVSENGTSTLLHDLFHVITRIRGKKNSDWIAEGLAEFYSIELQRRSGSMTEARYRKVISKLEHWSKDVSTLLHKRSSGPVTARAVLLFQALDQELQDQTHGQYNLDHVTRLLAQKRKVGSKDLKQAVERYLGQSSEALASPLLHKPGAKTPEQEDKK
jgi:hypothetical protein